MLLATAALLGLTASASAATIDVTNVQVPYGLYGITLTGGTLPGGGSRYTVYLAGQIDLTTSSGIMKTWCVDLFHVIHLGKHTHLPYTAGPLATNNMGGVATSTPLTQTQINEISVLAAWGNARMASSPTDDVSAAIQAAIWDVEYGSTASYSRDTGFGADLSYIETNVLPYATRFVGGVQLSDVAARGQFLSQGQFYSVPESSTWAMMLLGFAGLGVAGLVKARQPPSIA